jgi:hypothetical protein
MDDNIRNLINNIVTIKHGQYFHKTSIETVLKSNNDNTQSIEPNSNYKKNNIFVSQHEDNTSIKFFVNYKLKYVW